jgi:hypothetical protein
MSLLLKFAQVWQMGVERSHCRSRTALELDDRSGGNLTLEEMSQKQS